jgi:hypothetical protein
MQARESGRGARADLENSINYYIPPELRGLLGFAAEANPVVSMERAGQDAQRLVQPGLSGWDRMAAAGDMASNMAGVLAPMAAGRAVGMPAVRALEEGLLGMSMTPEAAALRQFGAEEAGGVRLPGVQAIDDMLRAKYPDAKISVSGDPSRGYTLNRIEVPKSQRSSGTGTAIMQDFVAAADAQGAVAKLSPSGDFGGSVPRLKDFYKRFGFVENKGKNADYGISESMYRLPQSIPAPADPATARGQEIMGMLTSGRAGEVTDQMLDLGDPVLNTRLNEYLYSNYDLPMDAASRMGRAQEMNADFGAPLYRGDARPDLMSFDTGQFARQGIGVTSSTSPNVAATYMSGDSPAMYQLVSKANNPLSLDATGRNWTGIPADAVTNRGILSDVLPPQNYLDEENLADFLNGTVVDWGDGSAAEMAMANTNDVSRAAQAAGFDEMRFRNVVDRGGAGRFHTGPANDPQTTVMTSNPADIRSIFARFDPRLSRLRNLNAALAAGVPLGLLAMQPEQEQY